jgi:hypothetical protein
MSDVFLGYAMEDRHRVEALAQVLEKSGWSVWWDRAIPPGKTFDEVIEVALAEAKCVVVVWSEHSVRSRWVMAEAEEANRRGVMILCSLITSDCHLPSDNTIHRT